MGGWAAEQASEAGCPTSGGGGSACAATGIPKMVYNCAGDETLDWGRGGAAMVGAGLAGVVVAAVVAVVVRAVAGAGWWGPGWRGWLARRRAQASCWRRPVVWWSAPPRGPVPATSPSSVPPPPRSNSISSRTLSNKANLEYAVEAAADFLNKAVKPMMVGGPKFRVAKAKKAFAGIAESSGILALSVSRAHLHNQQVRSKD
ncbi:Os11g0602250 [Oryza sativa Japonica Group]|uniref:Os11g0602250 protein n=1 Tax=Oryza sativa subsp. japonica TaxID=39947 RepID=A0A0N7KT66_ORYSJ|nr:Os11g0602250 [Oryza sativa Japonica Group]